MNQAVKCILIGSLASASSALAANFTVNQFDTLAGPATVNAWYYDDVRPGGSASIQNLTGMGGNLETAQPLPTGAARLTTDSTTAAKAQVSTYADFGLASQVLSSINLSYSYYKNVNLELFAAPSLKLTIYNPAGVGDSYGTLIYEPNWNQGVNGSGAVPSGSWQSVAIDENTGAGSDAGEGWWWNGGFNVGTSSAGPPIKSLAEWSASFRASTNYTDARVVAMSVGVGTYNINQDDYFDAVSIKTGNIDKTYDFQARSVPDGGSTLALMGMAFAGIAGLRRKFAA